MKRVLIVDDENCIFKYESYDWKTFCRMAHKDDNGKMVICSEKNCPLPKLPDIDYSTKTLPLDDYTGNYDDAYELGWERGQEAIIDAITGGTT